MIVSGRIRGLRGRLGFLGILRAVAVAVAVVIALAITTACAGPGTTRWAEAISEPQRAKVIESLPVEARDSLLSLSAIFYERIASRRFNSRATFQDPSMRQFFPTLTAYSDYYAALVDALDRANIRFNRPTEIELLGIEVDPSGSLRLSLRFVGRNDLPLRWWNAVLLRTDEWHWLDDRWWVVPGKV